MRNRRAKTASSKDRKRLWPDTLWLNSCYREVRVRDGAMPNDKAERLRDQADRCRRLAREVKSRQAAQRLNDLAKEFDEEADRVEARDIR
jgi:hypothetical protein